MNGYNIIHLHLFTLRLAPGRRYTIIHKLLILISRSVHVDAGEIELRRPVSGSPRQAADPVDGDGYPAGYHH